MIFRTNRVLFREGYIPEEKSSTKQFFFETANVAFRRQVFDDIGFFDTQCITAEDLDICCRAVSKGWGLFYTPQAKIYHFHRRSVFSLIKQWFFYGVGQPYVYKKFNKNVFTFLLFSPKEKICLYKMIFSIPFIFPVVIYFNPFHMLNFSTLIFVFVGFAISSLYAKVFSFLIFLGSFLFYVKFYYDKKHGALNIYFIFMRYLLSFVFVLGAFIGGIKYGVLDLQSALDASS